MRTDDEIKALIEQGYRQTSGRYGLVCRLPEDETGLEALERVAPAEFQLIMDAAERRAANHFRRELAQDYGHQQQLHDTELHRFRKLGGDVSW